MRAVGLLAASCQVSSTLATRPRQRRGRERWLAHRGRLAFRFEPSENFTITPRVVYQKLETDGYPRIDVYNILGNTFTTTETRVDPGERGQVTQIDEGLSDDSPWVISSSTSAFGHLGLTSVTTVHRSPGPKWIATRASYRQRHVRRRRHRRAGAPEFAAHRSDRPASVSARSCACLDGEGPFQWLVGAFYQAADRDYAQTLPTPGYDAFSRARCPRGRHTLLLALSYDFKQLRHSARPPTRSAPSGHSPAACGTTTSMKTG
jgi:iron complex outermembrane receptor protein